MCLSLGGVTSERDCHAVPRVPGEVARRPCPRLESPVSRGESLLGARSRREEAALLTFLKWLLEMSWLTA